jgi:cbb3-type cytochrome oxidase subunit 3
MMSCNAAIAAKENNMTVAVNVFFTVAAVCIAYQRRRRDFSETADSKTLQLKEDKDVRMKESPKISLYPALSQHGNE